jgi:tRNA-dihydrouridine synthase B
MAEQETDMEQQPLLQIGTLALAHRAVFAPMAGFTDAPCRALMAQHGAGYTVSEMVSAKAVTYGDRKTLELVRARPNGAPYGVQLFGADPADFAEAAKRILGEPFDFFDINMGCPAPKITGAGAGSRLLLDPALCGRITAALVGAAQGRPVTVKMRLGWDAEHCTAVEVARRAEDAGAAAIVVHGRTREQQYTPGTVDPAGIRRVREAVRIPVLANGDVDSAEAAVSLLRQTGCAGVAVARAALGDPWLFERINAALEGRPAPAEPNLQARMNAMRRQVEQMVEEKGEYAAMPQARAQTLHYMKGLRGAAGLRRACCTLQYLSDLDGLIAEVFAAQRRAADPDDARAVPFP